MKVILLQDVAKVGRRYDIVEVPTGHALNMLIPKGMAEAATPENVKKIKARAEKVQASRADSEAQLGDAIALVAGKTVEVAVAANEQGHLFEALKAESIAEGITALGGDVSAGQISIDTPIKEVGEHKVALREGGAEGVVTINVVAA